MAHVPLATLTQAAWENYVQQGDRVIDATAGNGYDTEALANLVGTNGRVFAIDIQEQALQNTRTRLEEAGLEERVSLIEANHAHLKQLVPLPEKADFSLVCFNLGYLPGGNHEVTTTPLQTMQALREALALLSPRGALSVVAYRGHAGALEEFEQVEAFMHSLPHGWQISAHQATGGKRPGPVWWLVGSWPRRR